ncbi:hypothetical protein [Cystobacter ferrugineus]|uniref:Uncharacterized protein n=1 Tax=Cystobacter ferrugineus TaxID=83449 RepID=A0A1L9BGZ9_9BACT|nr:hypothetical protein [Cystobacter ferrugineus]OJH41476.1 hypothetical protein BON30_11530 [Cystobacter ferrugineus]
MGFWRPDDQQITLHAFGFFGGSFEWVGRRDVLTGEQLEALSGLKFIPSAEGCAQDIMEYSLVVVDAAGQEREATAREDNSSCGPGRDVIDIETLKPLLATLECGATGFSSTELSKAKTVRADNGCQHAFFSYSDEPSKWLKVVASRPDRPHTFQVSQCEGKTTGLVLFDESGTVLLARGSAQGTSSSDCATLTHPLEAGRVYALQVTSQAVTTGGHVYLEIRGD